MFKPKSFSYELDTEGLSINEVAELNNIHFNRKDYDWWYEVLPGDVVVDVGCGIGAFAASALDKGAEKVYMIEPNRRQLKTAVKNVSDYIIDRTQKAVFPIHAAMGRTDIDLSNVFKSSTHIESELEPRLMTFNELTDTHKIEKIDFLKIDAAGAEYNILHKEYFDYLFHNVRHIAVRCHLTSQYGGLVKFEEWRKSVLLPFMEVGKVNFQGDNWRKIVSSPVSLDAIPASSFMIYITNW